MERVGGGGIDDHAGFGVASSSGVAAAAAAAAHDEEEAERFSRGVSDLLVAVEELRGDCRGSGASASKNVETDDETDVRVDDIVRWQIEVERVLQILDALARWTDDDPDDDIRHDMFKHCHLKATDVCQRAFCRAVEDMVEPSSSDDDENDDSGGGLSVDEIRQEGQRAIARLAEVNILMLVNAKSRGMNLPSSSGGDENSSCYYADPSDVVDAYVSCQKQVLRRRAKEPIALLVQARKDGSITTDANNNMPAAGMVVHHHDDDEDSGDEHDDGGGSSPAYQPPLYVQHHAPVVAAILGQAAALIHPLLSWRAALPPLPPRSTEQEDDVAGMPVWISRLTSKSIGTLDEQAQSLVNTVSGWMWDDRPVVDEWMRQSATIAADNCSSSSNWLDRPKLGILDGLVEEIAFGCQVQARYQAFVSVAAGGGGGAGFSDGDGQHNDHVVKIQTTIERELLPEWTWKYSALERFLAMQQLHSALELASPVHIVVGSDICVPSVVEDAQYLSTRALERAASTQNTQATGTVAHLISHDVWSTEEHVTLGVYRALVERRGCWEEDSPNDHDDPSLKGTHTVEESPKSGSAFASALLDALDDDLGPGVATAATAPNSNTANAAKTKKKKKPISAPSSGNFLANFVGGSGGGKMERIHLETEFCALNGMHAACAACRSLVSFLDSLLAHDDDDKEGDEGNTAAGNNKSRQETPPVSCGSQNEKAKAMIQLAREELFRYAEAYREMMMTHIRDSIESSCGSVAEAVGLRGMCFHEIYAFLENERYDIDATQMAVAEADERLDRELIEPLRTSTFLSELSQKCESDVLGQVGEVIVDMLVQLFLEVLWKTGKKVSDWGSLLLSKQVRLIQAHVNIILTPADTADAGPVTANLFQNWERLSQVLTVLQLEKPSDWLAYTNSSLTPDELHSTLSLRVEFSTDAIQAVVSKVRETAEVAGMDP